MGFLSKVEIEKKSSLQTKGHKENSLRHLFLAKVRALTVT